MALAWDATNASCATYALGSISTQRVRLWIVGMHLSQWMHNERLSRLRARLDQHTAGAAVDRRHALVAVDAQRTGLPLGRDPVDQVRLAQHRPAHRDELEALGHREVHRVAIGDPAEQDQRKLQL